MESSIQKVSKKEKTFISLRAHGLSVYCFRLYKDLVKMMSMYVRDEKIYPICPTGIIFPYEN